MKKKLTITISIAALFLTSCNNDFKPQDPTEKESQEEEQENGRRGRSHYHHTSNSEESSSNNTVSSGMDRNKSSTNVPKGKVSRGGFGHGGGLSGGG